LVQKLNKLVKIKLIDELDKAAEPYTPRNISMDKSTSAIGSYLSF